MLVVFAGLPGTGKTTLARALAEERGAVFLRIDTIEQALRSAGNADVGPAGYLVAYALAADNLRLGRHVVADCVNPLSVTRDSWRNLAAAEACPIVEIEVICSNRKEHRRRVETRLAEEPALAWPSWRDVLEREYEPWDRPRLVLDTAKFAPEAANRKLRAEIDRWRAAQGAQQD